MRRLLRFLAVFVVLSLLVKEDVSLVIVPLGDDGSISLFAQRGAHLLGDVAGYFTDAGADDDTAGLFVALTPGRVADTRTAAAPARERWWTTPTACCSWAAAQAR